MGFSKVEGEVVPPQQDVLPLVTRSAAAPYFALTTSLIVSRLPWWPPWPELGQARDERRCRGQHPSSSRRGRCAAGAGRLGLGEARSIRSPPPRRDGAGRRRCHSRPPRSFGKRCRRAHARRRQGQLHASRPVQIAGQLGHDRAHLLIAGEHEERRRPPVTLHPDHEEVRLGLAQLLGAVRRHRAAAVHVGIDERARAPAGSPPRGRGRDAAPPSIAGPAGIRSPRRSRRTGRARAPGVEDGHAPAVAPDFLVMKP